MRTLLKTVVATMLLLVFTGFTGPAVAAVLNAGSAHVDIGIPGVDPHQSGTVGNSLFGIAVSGDGSGFNGTTDNGQFLYVPVAGDGFIIAKIQFGAIYDPARMAGVMLRQSLASGAVNAANVVTPNEPVGVLVKRHAQGQIRTSEGGTTTAIAPVEGQSPGAGTYVRLDRTGDIVTFSWSTNGTTWQEYSEAATVPMTGTLYVGLAVTSGDNAGLVQANFESVQCNFASIEDMVWGNGGSNTWVSPSWVGPSVYPGVASHVLLDADNTDTVYVSTGDQEALSLTIDGGKVVVQAGRTLTIGETVNVGVGGFLELGDGAMIAPALGGTISHLTASAGDATLKTWAGKTVDVTHFAGNTFSDFPGTFTLQGGGTLQLDNLTGDVYAPYTTFDIEAGGTLASKGTNPLGNAREVILQGANLEVENAGAISMSAALTVTDSSTVNVNATGTSMGLLTVDGVTLTTSGTGGVSFASTDITDGAAAVTFNTLTDANIGAVSLPANAVTINKTGSAKLIVSGAGANLENANFNIQAGTLVGVNASDPFGPNLIAMNAGELVLANSTAGVGVFDNALSVTGNSTLTGGNAGLVLSGMKSVQLGSAGVNDVSIASGKTLTLKSTDDYMLDVAGILGGGGKIGVTGGNVLLSGGGVIDSGTVSGGVLMTTASLSTTSTGTDTVVSGGELVTMAPLAVAGVLRVSGGSATLGDTLGVGTLKMRGGVMVANGVVTAAKVDANAGSLNLVNTANVVDAVLSGTAMVSANDLVLSKSLVRGDTTYSVTTGTSFTVTGSDLLSGMNVAFGGTKLTVAGPGAQSNANIMVTANGSLAANTTAKAVFGDLTLNGGVTNLTLTTTGPGAISFADVMASDGAGITGNLRARGDVVVGNSPGTLDVVGNLTLGSTSVYNWELGSTGSDLINVSGNLALDSGWTLKIVSDASFFHPAEYTLFTFDTSVFPSLPTFDLSEADGWFNPDSLSLRVTFDPSTGGGNVLLDVVPEPATWAMLLGAGLMGLVGFVRRRRKSA